MSNLLHKTFEEFLTEQEGIKTVYVDLDGVLYDYARGVKDQTGKTIEQHGNHFKKVIQPQLYDESFFVKLKLMPGAKDFIRMLQANFPEVTILSAAGKYKTKDAERQKREAVYRDFGNIKVILVTSSVDKAPYARPDTLLIDDRMKAINPFKLAGGQVLLFKDTGQATREVKQWIK